MRNSSTLTLKIIYSSLVFMTAGCASTGTNMTLDKMKELSQDHALVVACPNQEVKTYDDGGIKPLFAHLRTASFKDCYVYDKVTGKASSMVLAYGGVKKLYTKILSSEAIPVLQKHNIQYEADNTVPYIINNSGTDKCPMEQTVENIDSPEEAFIVLQKKFDK